jgi:hypothetical protein
MKAKRNSRQVFLKLVSLLVILTLLVLPSSAYVVSAAGFQQSYIVRGASVEIAAQAVQHYGGRITSQLDFIDAVSTLISPQTAADLVSHPGILAVTPNYSMAIQGFEERSPAKDKTPDNNSTPATDYPDVTGAFAVWAAGDIGDGVTIAVVDTGLGWHKGSSKMRTARTIALSDGWIS